jgi:hypothetical protein
MLIYFFVYSMHVCICMWISLNVRLYVVEDVGVTVIGLSSIVVDAPDPVCRCQEFSLDYNMTWTSC